VIDLLRDGGRACILLPDGVLENPSFSPLRKDVLEKAKVTAIISLPMWAFAPYTKEKMYAVFFTKKNKADTKIPLRKGGIIQTSAIIDSSQFYLLPEYYLRPFKPTFATPEQLSIEISKVEEQAKSLGVVGE